MKREQLNEELLRQFDEANRQKFVPPPMEAERLEHRSKSFEELSKEEITRDSERAEKIIQSVFTRKNFYGSVLEFHELFNHPVSEKPTKLDVIRLVKRLRWIKEELDEFERAETLPEQVKELVDVLYFVIGTFVEMGVNPDEFFEIVHQSNMSKLENGEPLYDETGKIKKSKNYVDPTFLIEKKLDEENQWD